MVKKINTSKRIALSNEIVKEVLNKILHSECLNCGKNIDVSFKHSYRFDVSYKRAYRWRLPLCKECRFIFLEEIMK